MSSLHQARPGSSWRLQPTPRAGRMIVGALALVLQGCATHPTTPFVGPDPADASSPTPAIGHRSTIGPLAGMGLVDPAPWSKTSAPPAETTR